MNLDEVKMLVEAMYRRDSEGFAFEAMLEKAMKEHKPKQSSDPVLDVYVQSFMAIVADVLRMIAPDVFRAGYEAGVMAGMEISKEIRR